jgi:hypothetical protein
MLRTLQAASDGPEALWIAECGRFAQAKYNTNSTLGGCPSNWIAAGISPAAKDYPYRVLSD